MPDDHLESPLFSVNLSTLGLLFVRSHELDAINRDVLLLDRFLKQVKHKKLQLNVVI